ncbi:MAG: rod shape-determining protein MreC [Candidatus Cloacimonadota bacterium]|nr:rod shape-determining protein MreC [Candidatus Cloacimonadota bacterium]
MKKNGTLIVFVIISLFLLSGNHNKRIARAQFLSRTIYFPLISSLQSIVELFDLRAEKREIAEELAQKTIELNRIKKYLETIESIDFNFQVHIESYIVADIIGYTGLYRERNLIVNKGINSNVLPDLPVISSKGIVGKTINCTNNYSVILPFNHSDFKLSVMLKRNNLQGLLESDNFQNSYITQIKLGADIAVGDTVVTSNISSIFPKNYPVGKIASIESSPDKIYIQAKIEPCVDPSKLNQVIILLQKKDIGYAQELGN